MTRGRLPGHYHLLAARVARELADATLTDGCRRVTVKGVCADTSGRVLLCRNHRGDWELPGGRPEVGELFQDCLGRELLEETGLELALDRVLGVVGLEVLPGRWIDVVGYECLLPHDRQGSAIIPSHEHASVAFRDPGTLSDDEPPAAYRDLIARR